MCLQRKPVNREQEEWTDGLRKKDKIKRKYGFPDSGIGPLLSLYCILSAETSCCWLLQFTTKTILTNIHTQKGCNSSEETYIFKIFLFISRNILWVSSIYIHFHNDISSLEISVYNSSKPLHADATAEVSIKKQARECEQVVPGRAGYYITHIDLQVQFAFT